MFRVLLITGASGSGKTLISKKLNEYKDYNLIKSFTNRPQRYVGDNDHIYLSNKQVEDALLNNVSSPVATTCFGGYVYFTIEEQFLEERINVYVVDELGVCDTINHFHNNPNVECYPIKIKSDRICDRSIRDYHFISDDQYYQIVENNTGDDIDDVVSKIVCRYTI